MTTRQWYMGIAVGAAALFPLSAHAFLLEPDLVQGDTGEIQIKYTGVTTEIAGTVGSGIAGGSCSAITGLCAETTWGAGIINQSTEVVDTSNSLWNTNNTKNDSGVKQKMAFVIYGIADKDITPTGTGVQVDNIGATASTFGLTNGKINLDLYYYNAGYTGTQKVPCFTQSGVSTGSCSSTTTTEVTAVGSRTTNSTHDGITDAANVTGLTDKGQLFAHIELVPGASSTDPTVDLVQNVSAGTLPASGNGLFYADCISGVGCTDGQFHESLFNSILATFKGIFDLQSTVGSTDPQLSGENNAGWLGHISDPLVANVPVPEPASLGLLGSALAFLGVAIRRRRRNGMAA